VFIPPVLGADSLTMAIGRWRRIGDGQPTLFVGTASRIARADGSGHFMSTS
jgi:hypothetical protein